MRKKGYKGRCQKRKLSKCEEVCRTYDDIQFAYVQILEDCKEVKEIRCNVLLEGLGLSEEYTSDFVCKKANGDLEVYEEVKPKSNNHGGARQNSGARNKYADIIRPIILNFIKEQDIRYCGHCYISISDVSSKRKNERKRGKF